MKIETLNQSLVSISEASKILGVSQATLRQWTDGGKIRAFITPGGHRRYPTEELKKLIAPRRKTLDIIDLVGQIQGTAPLHDEIARTYLSTTPWYSKISQEERRNLARLGQQLLQVMSKYIAVPAKHEDTIQQARALGQSFGETLAKLGLPLTDAVEAFILHRDPIFKVTTDLMNKGETFNRRTVRAIRDVNHIMDEVLISLVAAHQESRNRYENTFRGDTL